MKTETYLKQIQKIDIVIKQKKLELVKIQSILNSGIISINYTSEKVKTSTSTEASFEKLVDKKNDLENEINVEINKFIDKQHTIINQIQTLENPIYVEVLYKKYVEYKPAARIAREIHYSSHHTMKLVQYALLEFEKKFLSES